MPKQDLGRDSWILQRRILKLNDTCTVAEPRGEEWGGGASTPLT